MNKVFKQHPNLKEYHETSDGVKFHTDDNAKAHAKSLKDKSIKKVVRGKAEPEPEPNAPEKVNPMQAAKLRVEAIEKMQSIAEIEKALEDETAKSVLKAGSERIAAIQATEALNAKESENVQNS